MAAQSGAATGCVVTVNAALALPAVTVTLGSTDATLGLLLKSATLAPPAGAGLTSVTVPATLWPAGAVVGFSAIDWTAGASSPSAVESAGSLPTGSLHPTVSAPEPNIANTNTASRTRKLRSFTTS